MVIATCGLVCLSGCLTTDLLDHFMTLCLSSLGLANNNRYSSTGETLCRHTRIAKCVHGYCQKWEQQSLDLLGVEMSLVDTFPLT